MPAIIKFGKLYKSLNKALDEGLRAAAGGRTRPAKKVFADVKAHILSLKEKKK